MPQKVGEGEAVRRTWFRLIRPANRFNFCGVGGWQMNGAWSTYIPLDSAGKFNADWSLHDTVRLSLRARYAAKAFAGG